MNNKPWISLAYLFISITAILFCKKETYFSEIATFEGWLFFKGVDTFGICEHL